MKHDPIVVIGAGIAGLSAAYYLNKAGREVVVLDKGDGTDNCSYGNAGMIVPSHIIPLASPGIISKGLRWMLSAESPFYIRPRLDPELLNWGLKFKQASTQKHVDRAAPVLRDLLMGTRELLIDLEDDESIDFCFRRKGLFMLCNTQKGLDKEAEVVEKANSLGMPARILDKKEVQEIEPNLEMEIIGAAYFPKDSHLYPKALLDGMKSLLIQRGVEFMYQTEVSGFQKSAERIIGVQTFDGKVHKCSDVVICAGFHAPELVRELDMRLPMQAGKGYSITIEKPKKQPGTCAILSEEKVTMTPMNGMLRFAGTMEITGNDRSVNPRKLVGLKKSVCRYLPEFTMNDLNDKKVWVGLRPISPDGMPYVGKSETYHNVYLSTGHAMMGMSLGPVSGKIITELMGDGSSPLEDPLIDPNRYC